MANICDGSGWVTTVSYGSVTGFEAVVEDRNETKTKCLGCDACKPASTTTTDDKKDKDKPYFVR